MIPAFARRIVPVVTITDPEHALPLADALAAGGLPLLEITLRTPAGLAAIRRIAEERPGVSVGAGTILTPQQIDDAHAAGAAFTVAPGFSPELVARAAGRPHVPGVCTPSEVLAAHAAGCRLLKFFPAETAGGVRQLSALASVFGHAGARFMPTGGIVPGNLAEYLRCQSVAAVGGTWLARPEDLAGGRWELIRQRAAEAAALAAACASAP